MKQELIQLPGIVVGTVAGVDDAGRPLVRWAGGPARSASVVWTPNPPDWKRCQRCRVAVGFVDGAEDQPVILGLLDSPPSASARRAPDILRIESAKELLIECGESKIALRADGRIEIRGGHLISRSSGPNKIKGGSVHIN